MGEPLTCLMVCGHCADGRHETCGDGVFGLLPADQVCRCGCPVATHRRRLLADAYAARERLAVDADFADVPPPRRPSWWRRVRRRL